MLIRRNNLWALFSLIVLLGVTCSAVIADENASSDAAMNEALNKMCESIGPKEVYLSKQLAEKPGDIGLRLKYADLLLDKGKIPEAFDEYTKVLQAEKTNVDALIGTAACYERQGKWRLALTQCAAACALQPGNADAVTVYLGCAQKHKVTGEALSAVHNLEQIDKTKAARAYWTVAGWAVQSNYWSAQPLAEAAHKLDPKTFPHDRVSNRPLYATTRNGKWVKLPEGQKWELRFAFGRKTESPKPKSSTDVSTTDTTPVDAPTK